MAKQKMNDVPKPPEFDELVKDLNLDNLEQQNEVSDSVPDLLNSFKERASRLGKSVKELLEDERKALRESEYPGPECLEPYELELYLKDALGKDRISHTDECVPCAALLKTAAPSTAGLNRLLAEIREEAKKSAPVAAITDRSRKWEIFTDAIATAIPIGVGVWAAVFFYWYRSQTSASEHIVSLASSVVIRPALFGLFGLLIVFALLAALVNVPKCYKFLASHRLLTSSGGAFAVSVTIALFLFYGTYKSLVANTRKSEIEMTLLQTQFAQAIASSINTQEKNQSSKPMILVAGLVDVQRISNAPNDMTYQATIRDFPGKLVAQVRDDKGELYWQPTKKKPGKVGNEEIGKLVLGTVKSVDSENLALVDKSGVSYNLKLPGELSPPPSRGDRVLAVIEPTSRVVQSVHSVSESR